MLVILATGRLRSGAWRMQASHTNTQDLIYKISKAKWTGVMAKVVERLLCKHRVLSSNPSTTQKKRRKQTTKMVEQHLSSAEKKIVST
jgi:hypothetical protein